MGSVGHVAPPALRRLFTVSATAVAAAHRYSGAHKHAAMRASMRACYKYADSARAPRHTRATPPRRRTPATLTYYPLNVVYFRGTTRPLPQRVRLCSDNYAHTRSRDTSPTLAALYFPCTNANDIVDYELRPVRSENNVN